MARGFQKSGARFGSPYNENHAIMDSESQAILGSRGVSDPRAGTW